MGILQAELGKETNPDNRAALTRELARVTQTGSPTGKPGAVTAAAPKLNSGGFAPPEPSQPNQAPVTSNVTLHPASGTVAPASTPVQVPPDLKWGKPQELVKAVPSALPPRGQAERAVVTYVEDGDTARLQRDDHSLVNCRIDTIDAPETAHARANKPGQAYGEQAKQALVSLIENKQVTLRITRPEKDQYGRNFCQIEIEGKGIDTEMVRQGAAWVYDYFVKKDNPGIYPQMKALETEARNAKLGLWADANPVNPKAFRDMLNYGR